MMQPIAPPSHIAYQHKLGRGGLTFRQIEELLKPINPAYVESKQSKAYLAQHQARAEMNRIFGYGNWDSQVLDMQLMYESEMPGTGNNSGKMYWVVGYRAHVQVNIRDLWGMPVTTFSEWHAEENAKQPNRGEAHALALTSVESYALRRALIGLGDRLGLGLYSGGSTGIHGGYSIQMEPGQLYTDAPQQPAPGAPAPQQTPEPQQGAETAPTPQAGAEQQTSPGLTRSPQMEKFHQAQQDVQQSRDEMRGRVQSQLKVDGEEE
ncbi:MAG: Rad52/Rad22 family DNA repair protein [Brachybacterium sp.]